jgi:hypothetical protein
MPKASKRSGSGSKEQSRSDFNWPPTEEELAPSGIDRTPSVHDRLAGYFNWPADNAAPQAPPTPDAEPVMGVGFTWPPPDEAVDLPRLESRRPEPEPLPARDESASGLATASADEPTEIEEIFTDQWVVHTARLQSMIEALTEKLEWRVTATPDVRQRLKH